jgi:methylmalonyl-CoA/ethylmalonyl-CoA epimerase
VVPVKLKRIDHVGVIVSSLDAARVLLEGDFGLVCVREVERPELRAAFFKCGNADIELIEILNVEMRKRRLGDATDARVEHIAIEVERLADVLTALGKLGIVTTGPPQVSPANTSVWTESSTSGGVMYQFLERPRGAENS